ncbi:MAG: S9 family peptidase [Chitinophagaceae bacterium]|nr:S9 family peptidase [Chitinophagaceae bacterium]
MRKMLPVLLCFLSSALFAQKKPLTHAVYDSWQSIGERYISNDGKFVAYTVTPQEGDALLVIQASDKSYKKEIPRGYSATITEDSRYIIFRIRPFFKDSREARIKKKKPEEMPKDSLAIMELGKDSIVKIARVKSYKTPEKGIGWIAYHLDKGLPEVIKPKAPDSVTQVNNLIRMADSLTRIADSIRNKANEAKTKGLMVLQSSKKETRPNAKPVEPVEEGTDLVLRNLITGEQIIYKLVNDYTFSKKGNRLVVKTTRKNADSLSKAFILWVNTDNRKADTVFNTFNDVRNLTIDEEGSQLAFVAERDSSTKSLQKFYKLWYFENGKDSARLRADRNNPSMGKGLTVSENAILNFSRDGQKLYFGITPIRKPKDTTLVDFETARLDIWHYNDDYLQPQQLVQANIELRRSYMAVLPRGQEKFIQLGNDSTENIILVDEGNADHVLAISTKGNRVTQQWEGFSRQTGYLVSTKDGSRKLVREQQRGFVNSSPMGKYVIWYDINSKNYYTYNTATGVIKNISKNIQEHLYDDEDDHPDDPPSFGIAAWMENDSEVLLNDRYDIWKVDPDGEVQPVNITNGYGKKNKIVLRYVDTDREKRFVKPGEKILLSAFNRVNKYDGFSFVNLTKNSEPVQPVIGAYAFTNPVKAKNTDSYIVGRMTAKESPDIYSTGDFSSLTRLSAINPQQDEYNWLTAELVKWKMFDGKQAEGLLFKPENFDPKKKYPVIFYFYEKNADGLYNYRNPAPSASTINIAYFVSNGYLVFDPNIYYKNGEPGESAYNSVVSAAKHMAKMPWVDSTKMAIQGQSWGGYQVAYLVTRTKMFAAAGAGAPVANMTSAYGGIRWGTGINRQFQYERSQSRLGATLWQRQDLYIKNSPLFKADKITTPLLIMHNDKDGAVPWYQGIELFTALRRLGKKAWLLQYNDEDHNLVERRNRKDLSIRLSQFFDYYLKGAPPARWIREGVPATLKGIEWGTEVEEKKAF